MLSAENINKVNECIVDKLYLANKSKITPDARICYDLQADSLDCIELVMSLEDEFNIEIPDADILEEATVQQLYDYIEKVIA